ncbi:MAG: tetratricopeptide repeat protein [Candidatus Aegiribacteria sp.]|nr:tetratricopeptide repeat protein [Candidatus Aegiribacteria sp.]MBD3294684.1 tetratricopeptide repeat protein [Candidatus Fermentibacteria bacterium]
MLNVIPRFINDKLNDSEELSRGSFEACVLYIDMVGFTPITEEMMKKGKHGAEELSVLINRIYNPLIRKIYRRGGFVASFAGDGITALFPGGCGQNALDAARTIQDSFHSRSGYYRKFSGGRDINVRIGLSHGTVSWSIYGEDLKAFCFQGDPVLEAARISFDKEPGEILLSENMLPLLETESGNLVLRELEGRRRPLRRIRPTLARQFYPQSVLRSDPGGEFRRVVPVFIGIQGEDQAKIESTVAGILNRTREYGGYFNGIFNEEKGLYALVVFGAPVSYENNADRALGLARALLEDCGNSVRVGFTSGTVFAGIVGSSRRCTYTVLGDSVNLAARIMQGSGWGRLRIPQEILGDFALELETGEPDQVRVKGKKEPLTVVSVRQVSHLPSTAAFQGALVGREDELKELRDFLEPVFRGRFAGVFYVYGEAGMGKSRLVADLTAKLPEVQTFVMQTDEVLRRSLNPFTYMLKEYFGQLEQKDREVFNGKWDLMTESIASSSGSERAEIVLKELKRTRSFIAAMLEFFEEGSLYSQLDGKGRFSNTLQALKAFFKAQSTLAPTVFVLEDMHWLDAESKTAVKNITTNVEDWPFAIIAPSRFTDDGSRPRLDLAEDITVREMELQPLSGRTEEELIEKRLNGLPDVVLSEFVMDRTEGNPFYIEQFCRYLQENGLLEEVDEHIHLKDTEFDIPESINAVIVARIDRLSARLKELVQTASVLGREFDVQVLSTMLKGGRKQLEKLLEKGRDEAIWTALSEIIYIFRHTLLRDVAYGMQLKRQLRELHSLAAGAMEKLYPEVKNRLADIAYHYEKAGHRRKASEYLRSAADFASSEYRNEEALSLFSRLLSLQDSVKERIETELETIDPLIMLGRWDEAEEVIKRNIRLAEKKGLQRSWAECSKHYAGLCHRRGDNDQALELVKAAAEVFDELSDEAGRMAVGNLRGSIYTVIGEFDKALEDFTESLALAERLEDLQQVASIKSDLGNVYLYRYELELAKGYFTEARRLCDTTGNRRAEANIVNNLAVIEYYRRNYDRCREYMDLFIEISEQVGDRESMAYVLGNIGVLQQQMGEYENAMSYYRRQLALAEELGSDYNRAFALRQIGHVRWAQGDYPSALESMKKALEICEKTGENRSIALTAKEIGKLYYNMGNYEKAKKLILRANAISEKVDREVYTDGLMYLAKIAMKENRNDEAADLFDELLKAKREIGEQLSLLDSMIDCSELLFKMGKRGKSRELMEESRRIYNEMDPCEMVYYLRFVENMHLGESDPEAAEKKYLELLAEQTLGEDFAGMVHFHLWRITSKDNHRVTALDILERLYTRTPSVDYQEYIDILKS